MLCEHTTDTRRDVPSSNTCQEKLQSSTQLVNGFLLSTYYVHTPAPCAQRVLRIAVGRSNRGETKPGLSASRNCHLPSQSTWEKSHFLHVLWAREEADIKGRASQVQRRFPRERLLTGHGAVDDAELVAAQHGLTAELLQLLIAAVMCQAASGGQTRGDEGLCLEVGPGESAGKDHLPPPLCKKGLKVGTSILDDIEDNINNRSHAVSPV